MTDNTLGWGANSYGDYYNGNSSGNPDAHNAFANIPWMDIKGPIISGIPTPRFFFVPTSTGSFIIKDGDYGPWRGDNLGTLNYEIYPAYPENLELAISVNLNQTVYTGEVFTVSYYNQIYFGPSNYGAVPTFFAKFTYSDNSYFQSLVNSETLSEGGTITAIISPEDNGKTLTKVSVGYYLDKIVCVGIAYQDSYNINMVITDLSFKLEDSTVIQRVDLDGTPVTLVNNGNLNPYDPQYLRLTGNTIIYQTDYYRSMSYMRELVRQGRFQFIQWD
jgi:hypothetical protein